MSFPPTPAPLDGARLAEICEGDHEFERELMDEYLVSVPPLIQQVQDALVGKDSDQIRRAAHTLKGASSSVGAASVYRISLALEMSVREGRFDEVQGLHEQLCVAYQELKDYLPVYFSGKAA